MFLSALDEVRSKALGFEAGGNDYLTKPFEALEVKARVHSLLKAKAYSDAVKQKIANELRIASEIQMGMLRHQVQEIVEGTGLHAAARMEPAREVGGDFYDIIRVGNDRVVVVVGDVSGKGVPAALFMAVSTTLARVIGRDHDCPGRILTLINNALVEQNPQTMFVTMACAVIDLAKGTLRYASGGHPSPVRLRSGQPPALPFDSTGPMVGVFPEVVYTSEEHPFPKGDGYVFYTDGVTEAMNAEGELFGNERLLASFDSLAAPLDALLDAVRAHAAGYPQSDDITIVTISRG
jgi:sigma-B regulation protein RsbU (phosphoserine phosphatase)